MEKLVHDLAELVSGLQDLTVDIVDHERERQIATQTVSDIDNVDSLRLVQEASLEASPLSVSVGDRLRCLESVNSSARTFFSARSRLGDGPANDILYGGSKPSLGSYFPPSITRNTQPPRGPSLLASQLAGGVRRRALEMVAEPENDEAPMFSHAPRPRQQEGSGDTASHQIHEGLLNLDWDQIRPGPLNHANLRPPRGSTDAPVNGDVATRTGPVSPKRGRLGEDSLTVIGPPGTPYSGGNFRIQFWMGERDTTDSADEEPAARSLYLRFLTQVFHPLVDADGYVHGQFSLSPALLAKSAKPPMGEMFAGDYPRIASMMSRVFRHGNWATVPGVQPGQVERLQNMAREWTKAYATPADGPLQGPAYTPIPTKSTHILMNIRAASHGTLQPLSAPSQENLELEVWKTQGGEDFSIMLVGYPSALAWEGESLPSVRFWREIHGGSHPRGRTTPRSLYIDNTPSH